ncbi:MAG: hypothetical protein ACLP00_16315 [Terracidiphilus sp.]
MEHLSYLGARGVGYEFKGVFSGGIAKRVVNRWRQAAFAAGPV